MSIEAIDKRKAIISKALGTEAGRDLMKLLREDFVDVNLMGRDDRETIMNVAKHDLVVYLSDMGEIT